ncbi:hypothetical protein [Pseudochrobactrum sp. MP213Fo]|uniref:hypothetical protein n=1 Tax=Pseudochrobactrum sp. MP213Fo TaxID=3022250 RepID=UPI003B9E61A5
MIIYEKNTEAQPNPASVVDKVMDQVCKAVEISKDSAERKELTALLLAEFTKGVTDHRRLVDMALAQIEMGTQKKKKQQRMSDN